MKMKYLLLAMFSVCSINFVHAEVVPGFSSSETYSPSGNTTVGFYETGGDGGNYMEWVIQNQCDVATDVTPNIYVDGSLKSNEEVRILPYQTGDGKYEVTKSKRTKPYDWRIRFDLSWSSDDALVKRKYWITAYAIEWNSEEYENLYKVSNANQQLAF